MRIIKAKQITDTVAKLIVKANISLRKDVLVALRSALRLEKKPLAKRILGILIENARVAQEKSVPLCQDTGMAVVFCEIGKEVKIEGDVNKAINEGIRIGSRKGFLRNSVVADPLLRKNTGTNTPCIIHYDFVKGRHIRLTVLPKGFGCENAGRAVMLKPTEGEREVVDFVLKTVKEAGADACPPFVLGIGIGGTMDYACLLAKKALLKKIKDKKPKTKNRNQRLKIYSIERELLFRINKLNIGPMGLGGRTTALAVNIERYPTHIAGLPVAVNINCHAMRSASKVI